MKLSEYEQQILDEIQQGVRIQDPEFFASMAGSQSRRGGTVWGSATLLAGLVMFMAGAVLAQTSSVQGVAVSLIGFLAMFWGVWLLCSGDRASRLHGQDSAVQRRAVQFWESMKDPPPPGMSP